MKFIAPLSATLAVMNLLFAVYNHDLHDAAAWASATWGWITVSLIVWND
jgi:hypothetical protein